MVEQRLEPRPAGSVSAFTHHGDYVSAWRHNEGGQRQAREHAGKGIQNVSSMDSILLGAKNTKYY